MKGLHTLNIGPGSDGKLTGAALVFPGDGTDPVRVPLNAHYIRQIELVVARAANDLGSALYYALAMEDKGEDEAPDDASIIGAIPLSDKRPPSKGYRPFMAKATFHDPEEHDE